MQVAVVLIGSFGLFTGWVGTGACDPSDFDPRSGFVTASRIVEVDGVSMHVLECGDGAPVVFVHGQPTSTYLWRDIAPVVARGHRAIVVDLAGFGRSERPASLHYDIEDHERLFDGLMDALAVENVTLVVHDWGGYLGLRWASLHPERVRALVLMEAILPVGLLRSGLDDPDHLRADSIVGTIFAMAGRGPRPAESDSVAAALAFGDFLELGVARALTDDERAAYLAPFSPTARPGLSGGAPDLRPVSRLPRQIPRPHTLEAVRRYSAWLTTADLPKLVFSVRPGVLSPPDQIRWLLDSVPEVEHVPLGRGFHFVQEDHGPRIGREIAEWLTRAVPDRTVPAGTPAGWTMPPGYRSVQIEVVESQRAFLHAMIDSMPEEHIGTVDNPGQRSFAGHVHHAGVANAQAVDRFIGGPSFTPPDSAASVASRQGLHEAVDRSFDFIRAALEAQSHERRQAPMTFAGVTVPAWRFWDELNEHTYWTLGEMVGNFRSLDMAPPSFRFF